MSTIKSINDLFSEELKVTPLTGEQVQEFRLIRCGVLDPTSGKLANPAGHGLASRDMIKDPWGLGDIEIQNIVSHKAITEVGRPTIYDPVIEPVMFPSTGSVFCGADDLAKFFYLKRQNGNRDNPYRIRKRPAVYYEVNHAKEVKLEKDKFEYKRIAFNIIAEADPKELLSIAYAINQRDVDFLKVDMNQKGDALTTSLNQIAEKYPSEVIKVSDNDRAKLTVYVDEAVAKNMIMFIDHPEKRLWKWMRAAGSKGKQNIVTIEPGNSASKGLVDFLLQVEGAEHKAELLKRSVKESPVLA